MVWFKPLAYALLAFLKHPISDFDNVVAFENIRLDVKT